MDVFWFLDGWLTSFAQHCENGASGDFLSALEA